MEISGPAAVAVADGAAAEVDAAAEGLSDDAVVVVPDEHPVTSSRVAKASAMRRVIARTRIDERDGSF
jgi:hypothetical protein